MELVRGMSAEVVDSMLPPTLLVVGVVATVLACAEELLPGTCVVTMAVAGLVVAALLLAYLSMLLAEHWAYSAGSSRCGELEGPMQPTRYGCQRVPT